MENSFSLTKKLLGKVFHCINDYVLGKQTLAQLSISSGLSKKTLQRYFDDLVLPVFNPLPREIILVLDATYFGKKKDKDGLLLGKDWITKEIVYYDFIKSETKEVFLKCRYFLEQKGFKIKGVVVDGRIGVKDVFNDLPLQMCQFHQIQIVNRYLTKNPKLHPSKQLKTVIEKLTKSTYFSFTENFKFWFENNKDFLNEKTMNLETKRSYFTHKRIRSAVRSIQIIYLTFLLIKKNLI